MTSRHARRVLALASLSIALLGCTLPKDEADSDAGVRDGGGASRDGGTDAGSRRDAAVDAGEADAAGRDAGCARGACAADPWPVLLGGEGNDEAHAVAIRAGTVYVAGHFFGTADFGDGPHTAANGDAFIAHLDPGGASLGAIVFGGARSLDGGFPGDLVTDLASTTDGVVATGAFAGPMRVAPDADELAWGNSYDLFVARFDGSLGHVWSRAISAPTWTVGRSLAVVASEVFVVGEQKDVTTTTHGLLARFAVDDGTPTRASDPELATGGPSLLWSVEQSGAGFCVAGCITGVANFLGRSHTAGPSPPDVFVGCYHATDELVGVFGELDHGFDCGTDLAVARDSSVGVVRVRQAGSSNEMALTTGIGVSGGSTVRTHASNVVTALPYAAIGPGDDVFVAIAVAGSIEIDGVPTPTFGGADIVVARYSQLGVVRWARRFGGTGDDAPQELVYDGAGHLYVVGYVSETVDFDGHVRTSRGGRDALVLRLDAETGNVR